MAYLGRQPIIGNYQVLDPITATTTDTYALTKNSVAVFPQTPANCIVSLNGVIQAPVDSYTISGSNIVFASALTASDSIDFITVLGDVLNVGTVSDGTITTAKLDSSLDFSSKTITLASNMKMTPAFEATASTDQSGTHATFTKVNFNTEVFDTDGNYDNSTNYRFTPTTAGKYYIYANVRVGSTTPNVADAAQVAIYKNGSAYKVTEISPPNATNINLVNLGVFSVIEFNGSSDYVEVFYYVDNSAAEDQKVFANATHTVFGGYKLLT